MKTSLFACRYVARVLGKTGEFEGEPQERLSSLRRGKAGPVATKEWASTAEQRGFFPLKKSRLLTS